MSLLESAIKLERQNQESWPPEIVIIQKLDDQMLLPESALSYSLKCLFRQLKLEFKVIFRDNAEFMSPGSCVPFVKIGKSFLYKFDGIVEFLSLKNESLTKDLKESEKSDIKAFSSIILNEITNCELYLVWLCEKVFNESTYPCYGSKFNWFLKGSLCREKRNEIRRQLGSFADNDLFNVLSILEMNLSCLAEYLCNHDYMIGDKPTELDALIYGHITALSYCNLPNINLNELIPENLKSLCEELS